ncbi:hypothetical protein [Cerasicoccus maritimus]|uniref:hypothetical protein n=1 Tax=Cerasicoccus maritimus TaxID=490089 RepID=UPI0028525248|nr:hypothetical protein [Cerasicoccus maritimus]
MSAKLFKFIGVYILFLILTVFVFHRVALQGTHSFLNHWDATAQSYAWSNLNAKAAQNGTVALWDFSMNSGGSHAGEMQPAPMYPINWLWAFAEYPLAPWLIDLRLLFHFALAGFGMYFFLRGNQLHGVACLVGATIFTFVGSVAIRAGAQPNIYESLAYMPLVLAVYQAALRRGGPVWRNHLLWWSGILLGFMIIAGHMQPYIHTAYALGIITLAMGIQSDRISFFKAIGMLLMAGLISALFSLPQMLLSMQYLGDAFRWLGGDVMTKPPHIVPFEVYAYSQILEPWELGSLFFNLEGGHGEGTLFFTQTGLVLAVLCLLQRRNRLFWFGAGMMIFAVLVSLGHYTVVGWISYVMPLMGQVREPVRAMCMFTLGAATIAAMGCHLLLVRETLKRWRLVIATGVFALVLFESYIFENNRTMPLAEGMHPSTYYAKEGVIEELELLTNLPSGNRYRYQAFPNDLIPPNSGNVYELMGTRGHRATMGRPIFNYFARDWDPHSANYDVLGLRYLVSNERMEGFKEVRKFDDVYLYEREGALPVLWLLNEQGEKLAAPVESVDWGVNSVRITLEAEVSGLLVFAQPDYPGWVVSVDGLPRDIEVWDIFQAVMVSPGDSIVEFAYRPKRFFAGLLVALGVLLFAMLLSWRSFKEGLNHASAAS